MKRILLTAGVLAVLALTLGGCTMDGDKIVVTDPPRVTSNVNECLRDESYETVVIG